ncbi:MAG: DNA repair protein RecN [Bacteroidota bacterium]
MLMSLQIRDYALIENIHIEFGRGLNIITGETGAGKSILIEALGLLLGERASNQVVRKGANKSVVEGIFDVAGNSKVETLLKENEIEFYSELILRREISLKGSNRCFINDTPAPLTLVKDAGNLLIDMHGQHEHQSLLRTNTHIEFLDELGEYDDELNAFILKRKEFVALIAQLNDLKEKESKIKAERDIYEFQLKEIDEVSPVEGEEEQLKAELNILENSEKLLELCSIVFECAYDLEDSAHNLLVKINNALNSLSQIDKSFEEIAKESDSAVAITSDIADFVRSYKDKIDLEDSRLEEIRERLASLNMLKKRYGGSLEKVIANRDELRSKLDLAVNFNEKTEELKASIEKFRNELGLVANQISGKRKKVADKIKSEMEKTLDHLGISSASFKTEIANIESTNDVNSIKLNGKAYKHNPRGFDEVEFFISTNIGEDLKPLAKIASGGEVSRIMLALKTILAKSDKLPLLIFDEIDTGVSGRIAQKVGQSLKDLSKFHQIIAITHLPQIASLAEHHFSVKKVESQDRVASTIQKLSDQERITEVAKLISGENVTNAGIESARQLMGITDK